MLPRGWTFNNLDGAGAEYSAARVEANEVVLTRPDGEQVTFTRSGPGFTPPAGEDDVVALVNGRVTVTTTSGSVHAFREDGQLESVTAAADTRNPSALRPTWTQAALPGWDGPTSRMTSLADPVSGSSVAFEYQSVGATACPVDAARGFVVPPAGMLCRVVFPDGAATQLWYSSDNQGGVVLSRITNPGGASIGSPTVDYGYTLVAVPAPNGGSYTVPMLSSVRDALVNDAIAAGVIADSADYRTLITYDGAGRATSIAAPKPSATATGRLRVSIDYQGGDGVVYDETRTRVDGLDNPNSSADWDRKVLFDSTARVTADYQALDATSSTYMSSLYGWDPLADRVVWQNINNQVTRNVYSPEGWLTERYGPANAACFAAGSFMPNGSCVSPPVPHTSREYDGGLNGLSVSYWPNPSFSGPPTNVTTGLGPNAGSLSNDWGLGGPPGMLDAAGNPVVDNFSMRLTGSIVFPTTGTYTFTVGADDFVSVYVDDQLVAAANCCSPSSGVVTITGSTTKRIRIDAGEYTGGASFGVLWAGPGINGTQPVPTSSLKPRYGLETKSTVDDSGGAPSTVTTTEYTSGGLDAVFGLVASVTSGGLTTTYRQETTGLRRPLSRTLPGGNTYTYVHYAASGAGSSAAVDVPCTSQNDTAVHQGGRQRLTIAPAAANGKAVVTEQVFDVWGRVVASRYGTRVNGIDTWEPSWSCTTFDARQRVVSVTVPARGAFGARTVSTTYPTDPRVTRVGDSSGYVESAVDFVGNVVSYTDVWQKVTTSTYDAVTGRLTQNSGPTGTTGYSYDRAGRVTRQTSNGLVVAIPTYNTPGSANEHTLASISYPSGAGNAGNGTTGTYTRDSNGALTGITWRGPTGTVITSDSVVRSQSGRVVDQSIDGIDAYPAGANFSYDAAGRLVSARVSGGKLHEYGFGAASCGANVNAGANSNRTSLRVDGVTAATYCYDMADRLTSVSSSTAPFNQITGSPVYDDRGNTTGIGGEVYDYDGSNRHMATYAPNVATPRASVVYQRDVTDRLMSRVGTYVSPVSVRATTTASSAGASVSSTTVVKPSTVSGDVLVAAVVSGGSGSVTAPAGWSLVAARAGTGVRVSVFTKAVTASEPASYVFGLSSPATMAVSVSAYAGVDVVSPVDVSGVGSSTVAATVLSAGSVVTSGSYRQVLGVVGAAGGVSFTPGSGLVERSDVASGTGGGAVSVTVLDRSQAGAGASGVVSTTATASVQSAWVTVALRPLVTVDRQRYVYSATGDTGDAVLDTAGNVIETTVVLPGGVVVSQRGATAVWSYPNVHGDVQATATSSGVKQGATVVYDPFGVVVAGSVPDNVSGGMDYGWLGQHQRPLERGAGLKQVIEMGARPYQPLLGRFLTVDPIEGGTPNAYVYVHDPINDTDLTGMCSRWNLACKALKAAKKAGHWVKKNSSTIKDAMTAVTVVAAVGVLIVGTGGTAGLVLAGAGLAASTLGTAVECFDGGKRQNCAFSAAGTLMDAATFGAAPLAARAGRWIPSAWQGVSLARDTWGRLGTGDPRNRGCPSFAPTVEMGGGVC